MAKSDTLSSSQGGEFSSEKRLCVARIATAHGIKGYVRAKIFMENPHDIEDYNPLFTSETGAETLHVTLKNPIKNQWLVEIKGVYFWGRCGCGYSLEDETCLKQIVKELDEQLLNH
mgnify:CR=1 FL=1